MFHVLPRKMLGDGLCILGSAFSLVQSGVIFPKKQTPQQLQQHGEAWPGMGAPLPAPAQLLLQNNRGFGLDLLAQQENPQTELMGER